MLTLDSGFMANPSIRALNEALLSPLKFEFGAPQASAGWMPLREALAEKLRVDNDIAVTAEQVVVTTGAMQALHYACQQLLEEGDEVLIPQPSWDWFAYYAEAAGGKVRFVECFFGAEYKLTASALAAALTPETKLLMWTNPTNPGSALYTKEEVDALVAVLEQYPQLQIISDEVYELSALDRPFYSLGAVASLEDRVVTINGFSKSFGLATWRVGYLATRNADLCARITKQLMYEIGGVSMPAQRMALAVLVERASYRQRWAAQLPALRQLAYDFFANIEGVDVYYPKGAFYIFPDFSQWYLERSTRIKSLAEYIEKQQQVRFKDGAVYGMPWHLRVNISSSEAHIQEGLHRLRQALDLLA